MNITRYFTRNPLSKPISFRKESHLKWVRNRPCFISHSMGDDVQAHHVQYKSHGVNDYLTVPICAQYHRELHDTTKDEFESKHGVITEHALIACLVERIIELEQQLSEK